MKLSELCDAPVEGNDPHISGISADSRAIEPGFLFAALPGEVVDGAKFIGPALAAGAAAILTHSGYQDKVEPDVPLLKYDEPRLILSQMAARFYAPQPAHFVAVTGTNGKTSVASFVRQIWAGVGIQGASVGTVGIVTEKGTEKLAHTTPDPVTLHAALQGVKRQGIDHVVIEASSHGLQQRRLDGLCFEAAAFTNITRDHLDYHKTFEAYFREKQRLFTDLLKPGAPVVIGADSPGAADMLALCKAHGLKALTVGRKGGFFKVTDIRPDGFGQLIELEFGGKGYQLRLPLVGDFQVANALVAAALVVAGGAAGEAALAELETLEGATGRLELVGSRAEAPVFVDYAHTPDALARAIEALLPYKSGRLIVVFGCGGDRDTGKRAEMGAAAQRLADMVIVTDDNPRSEDPALIRRAILAAAPSAVEIGDRAAAIATGVEELGPGDVLLVAGKGHETGQIVGSKVLPFSDHAAVREALASL